MCGRLKMKILIVGSTAFIAVLAVYVYGLYSFKDDISTDQSIIKSSHKKTATTRKIQASSGRSVNMKVDDLIQTRKSISTPNTER